MKIGLFFGSFNPIHTGHLIIANHIVENTELNELWFVVSPHSPFKEKKTLASDYDRLHLVNISIENNPNLRSSNIEFTLPKPSYTVDTLIFLREKFPMHEFTLIMGGDNLKSLHKWKNAAFLAKEYPIIVYKRPGEPVTLPPLEDLKVSFAEGPLLNISASFIRKQIKAKRSIKYLVPDPVFDYLQNNPIYD